jgi:23S rRNA (pseudouridine1915-N3)-methyltransferase
VILLLAKLEKTKKQIKNVTIFWKMFIKILAIGKINNSPYQDIFNLYHKRIKWNINIKELEIKENSKKIPEKIIIEKEEKLFLENITDDTILICLDSRGKILSTEDFSEMINNYRESSHKICFAIGGASGFGQKIRKRANHIISFGKITLPHLMARAVLIEQIYRSYTIINNHPYHNGH